MKLLLRPYRNEYDYYKIRAFLSQTLLLHGRKQINWPLYRWDYWRWHINANIFNFRLEEVILLWETEDGEPGAVLNPDGRGEAILQIHPRHRDAALVEEMLSLAEQKYSTPDDGGQPHLRVWAHESDAILKQSLVQRGYAQSTRAEFQRWMHLDCPIHRVQPAPGYTLRTLGGDEEIPARSWASWRAFHPDEPDESYQGWEWYRNVQRAPLYRRDLDLVTVAPSGEIASFATVWYDPATRSGAFEPVGTMPEHQRKGLSRSLLNAGLLRLQKLGAVIAYVSSYESVAHAAYESVGFSSSDRSELWFKRW
jgi:GNAT superfamily N-acetyltransferase